MKSNLTNRSEEQFILQMEISDIIFRQHTNTYMPLNIVIIVLQLIIMIVGILLQIVFREHKELMHIISYSQMTICIILCILVVINNRIAAKAWKKARKDYKELLDILGPSFGSNYTVDDQTIMIHRIAKYKERQRLGGNHFKKRKMDKDWKKQDIEMLKKMNIK